MPSEQPSGTGKLPPGQVTDPEKLTTDEVRQGVTGHGVRYVLAFSLGATLIALIGLWVLFAAH